ncbi:MAG: hypothetical protein IPP90_09200 [Gemmatimonadaceae bacterium]|nr:hypothetical protein [Gemmatimonadaceae bacterium]
MAFPARFAVAPLFALLIAGPLAAQQPPTPPASATPPAAAGQRLSLAELRILAEAQVAIAVVLDSSGAELAQVRNKTPQAQVEMQAKRKKLVADALTKKGMSVDEFERRRYLVSNNTAMRFQFDSIVAGLTGQALPGTVVAAAAAPVIALPAGLVGIAVGYVAANYLDTPGKAGLLAMARTEAGVAVQHAGFMARALDNLQTLQMHAGHVLHAIDPGTMPTATAPGKGYGVKRALDGVIAYSDLAAATVGASANVKAHTPHIIAAARSTSKRADQVIAIARKIQSATTATAAAALVGQLTSLCNELVAGIDLNADGKIGWGDGEGGLQQAQDHMNLLLAGEKKP